MESTIINAVAPTRICDVGGWTDTRFAQSGAVLNFAVSPQVEVKVSTFPPSKKEDGIILEVENYDESYTLNPANITYDRHPLIEASIKVMELPHDTSVKITILAHAPPGASMGTSAAVSVAIIGALNELTQQNLSLHEIATLAHSVETQELGLECGIQDQFASVYGGVNFIEIHDFPHARVTQVKLSDTVARELEQKLLLTYIGQPHVSSEIHKLVLADLGSSAHNDERLIKLRELARQTRDTLHAGDVVALGHLFNKNTQVQRELHKELVGDDFEAIISLANEFDALGCKVNGAGGDGGSIAILTNGSVPQKQALQQAIEEQGFHILPIQLAPHGLQVSKSGI